MRRLVSLLVAWALILGAPLSFAPRAVAQVTTDATKTKIPTGTPIGTGTYASMKTLTCSSSVNDGAGFLVTNYGHGGSMWRCSGTVGDWFPAAPIKIYENTAVVSGVTGTSAQVLVAIPIEANLLQNKVFRVMVTFGKTGATDTMSPVIRMGSAGTVSDNAVITFAAFSAAVRSAGYDAWMRMASATSAEKLGGAAGSNFAGTTTSAVISSTSAVAAVTSANYITITTTMGGSTDTPQLGYVAVEIEP